MYNNLQENKASIFTYVYEVQKCTVLDI